MQIILKKDPFLQPEKDRPWQQFGQWPASWICFPDHIQPPFVSAFRCRFSNKNKDSIRLHVSADERYELFLDGRRIGRGSERGDPDHWFFETYDISVQPGQHVMVARVWSLGEQSPWAQMHVEDGFLLCAEGNYLQLLSTGLAHWEVCLLNGYQFVDPEPAFATGARFIIDGREFPWGFENGVGQNWRLAKILKPALSRISTFDIPETRYLHPAMLPSRLESRLKVGAIRYFANEISSDTRKIAVRLVNIHSDFAGWQALIKSQAPLTIPANTIQRVIIDLENYFCTYPEIRVSGGKGGSIRILWSESLFNKPGFFEAKGNRDEIDNKYFWGVGYTFLPEGGHHRSFNTLWWEAGRYIEVVVETKDEPLIFEELILTETRYPIEFTGCFSASDNRLEEIIPILVRGLQMNAHETYMDCPYYEQLMYAGDTRLEALTTYVTTLDERLPRKALEMFNSSRRPDGMTQSRYPNRVFQVIPPFNLWWVAMVNDYAFWRGDLPFVSQIMPGVHASLEGYCRYINEDGLVQAPAGWNFMDWVPGWEGGIPPDGAVGVNGLLNWQFIMVLRMISNLETMLGNHDYAARYHRTAIKLAQNATAAFWDDKNKLFSDDLAHQYFSEHTQCLAILSGSLDPYHKTMVGQSLSTFPDLARTTVYFSHYLFDAYREIQRIDLLIDRMDLWFDLKRNGFKTPVEQPEPSRSDCHAWGSHPLYHYFATILGIRPASLGFKTVTVHPQLGTLSEASGKLVHPNGQIIISIHKDQNNKLHGEIDLPQGITGNLKLSSTTIELGGGLQTF